MLNLAENKNRNMKTTKIKFEDHYHSIEIEQKKEDLDINEFFELCINLAKAVGYHDSTINKWLKGE